MHIIQLENWFYKRPQPILFWMVSVQFSISNWAFAIELFFRIFLISCSNVCSLSLVFLEKRDAVLVCASQEHKIVNDFVCWLFNVIGINGIHAALRSDFMSTQKHCQLYVNWPCWCLFNLTFRQCDETARFSAYF